MKRCLCGKEFREKSISGHYAKCKIYQDRVNEILTESFLVGLVDSGESFNYISKKLTMKYGILFTTSKLKRHCKKYSISTPTIKESSNKKKVRDRYKETCVNKYGKENALSFGTSSYKKRNDTVQKKYGVENVFQLESTKEKSKNSLFEKYGVYNSNDIPNRYKNSGRKSGIHRMVEDVLKKLSIEFESEKTGNLFKTFNEYLSREYSPRPDILLKKNKVVIEINGGYWHGDPRIYKKNDIIYKWSGKTLVEDIWKFDNSRKEQIESFGYKVITFWEMDILNNIELIEGRVCKELKLKA